MKLSAIFTLAPLLAIPAYAFTIRGPVSEVLESRATERDWEKSVSYGKEISAAMKASTDAEAKKAFSKHAAATYTKVADLTTYDWVKDDDAFCLASCSGQLDKVYDRFSILKANDKDIEYANNAAKNYAKTKAKVAVTINVAGGMIVADNSRSPTDSSAKVAGQTKEITPLKQWSDVAFLEWYEQAADAKVKDLKYIVRALITNSQTRTRIKEALQKDKKDKTPLFANRAKFASTTDQFAALLGSPNGSGAGFLVSTHKAQLGHKTISEVEVWAEKEWDLSGDINASDIGLDLYMMFTVVAA